MDSNDKYTVISYKREGNVGIVTLSRPEALNALNARMFLELAWLFKDIKEDNNVKVAVITGAGEKAFAAGSDIEELFCLSPQEARAFALKAHDAQEEIASLPKPTIAALNGYALGGGLEVAMCCDIRIASETAKVGQPEINLGIIPGGGGTQRLTRLIGSGRAKELLLTGAIISAGEALALGLVNRTVPGAQLMSVAIDLARKIAEKSGPALGLAKCAVDHGIDLNLDAALHYEIECFAECFGTEEGKAGLKAFIAKQAFQVVFSGTKS